METPSKEVESQETAGSPTVETVPTDPVEIRELIRKQIEYYFSKENLVHDAFLTSQMDSQMSAPISVIMKFGKIKVLTQDENVLKEALADSTSVSIVDDRIKSSLKPVGRSTLILRDIGSDVPEEEVRGIFAYDGCKPISSVRKDIENTWFVFMDSEEDAKDTVLDLKLKKRTFRGEPVKCRLKTEAVVKSYFPVSTAGNSAAAPYMMPPYSQMDMRMYGYGGGWQGNSNNQGEFNADGSSKLSSPKDARRSGSPPRSKDQNKAGGKDSAGRGDRKNQQQQRGLSGKDSNNGRNGQQNGRGDRNNKMATGSIAGKNARAPSFDLSGMNFPPLAASEVPIPQPGYQGEFTKYTHDDIINIVKNISAVVLPGTIEPEQHEFAMTDTPNMDLLQRQRTFSIDETREQLRQGKPVQRDAVIGGAVDLQSMYYGDHDSNTVPASVAPPVTSTNTTTKGNKPEKSGGSWAGILMKSGPPAEAGPPLSASSATPKKPQPAAAEVPKAAADTTAPVAGVDGKKDDKSGTADKKGKGEKKGKDGKRGDGRRAPEAASEQPEKLSSWGGKPSFATILKQAEQGDVTPAVVAHKVEETAARERSRSGSGPSTPARKGRSTEAAPSSPEKAGWGNRNKSGASSATSNKAGSSTESKIKEEASGAWVREKLPPVQDKA